MIVKSYSEINTNRITVLIGHAGSGKTECAVNLALALQREGKKTTIADLDVVNPYFRSRECSDLFKENGIRLIHSSPGFIDADLPSMSAEVTSIFDDPTVYGVMDIGGDPTGARVLGQYRHKIRMQNGKVYCIINASRPFTDTPEKGLDYVRRMEAACGMPVDGLINNTHFCSQTSREDILYGLEQAERLEQLSGIPLICTLVRSDLAEELADVPGKWFPIEVYMKKPWE